MLSDLYPNAMLSKVFIAPIFEQVVVVVPWYTVEKAMHLGKDMLTMSRNIRLSNAENLVVETIQTETSSSSTRIIKAPSVSVSHSKEGAKVPASAFGTKSENWLQVGTQIQPWSIVSPVVVPNYRYGEAEKHPLLFADSSGRAPSID
jgi:hypothetical protein